MPENISDNETTLEEAGDEFRTQLRKAANKTRTRKLLKEFGKGVLIGFAASTAVIIGFTIVAAAFDVTEAPID